MAGSPKGQAGSRGCGMPLLGLGGHSREGHATMLGLGEHSRDGHATVVGRGLLGCFLGRRLVV